MPFAKRHVTLSLALLPEQGGLPQLKTYTPLLIFSKVAKITQYDMRMFCKNVFFQRFMAEISTLLESTT